MTKEQFKNKYVGKAVHCDTEEKAKEFLALASKFGWTWCLGSSLDNTNWKYGKDETCYRVRKNHVITYDLVNYYKTIGIEIVKFESEEKKMKKTKRVFDLGLYMDWAIKTGRSQEDILASIRIWALKSHGKTEEEMGKNGRVARGEWMKEVEVKLSEKEIEVLKALKVLDFKWIARDKDYSLEAYEQKPTKNSAYYERSRHYARFNPNLFNFISWKDEEATSIEELLKEC